MLSNQEALKDYIISLSMADDFESAKSEWQPSDIKYSDSYEHCPCGQQIEELCYIINIKNGSQTFVGNTCIKRFMGIDTGNAFNSLRRIFINDTARPNKDLIEWAYKLGYIRDQREVDFLLSIQKKKTLSEKQKKWLMDINNRIIHRRKVRK